MKIILLAAAIFALTAYLTYRWLASSASEESK